MGGSAPKGARARQSATSRNRNGSGRNEIALGRWVQLNRADTALALSSSALARCAARAALPPIQLRPGLFDPGSAHASLSLRILPPQGGKGIFLWIACSYAVALQLPGR